MADTAVELLSTHPAMTTDAIAAVIVERGQTRAKDPVAAVRAALDVNVRLDRLHDGRWVAPVHLLDGAVLTHELREDEARAGALEVTADVAPLWRPVLARIPLASGGHVGPAFFDETLDELGTGLERAMVGPTGWLPTTPGAFLHLRVSGGVLSVTEGARPRAAARMTERRLATSAQRGLEEDIPEYIEDHGISDIAHVVFQALVEAPGLLDEPTAPLGDLLRAAGLEVHETEVGLRGTDWSDRGWSGVRDEDDDLDDDGMDVDAELAELTEDYDLTEPETEALRVLLVALALESVGVPINDPGTLSGLAHALEQPILAELVAERAWHDDGVGTLAARILRAAAPDEHSGVRLLLAAAADAADLPEDAEAHLRAGLEEHPDFPPSLIALAAFEEDRGRYLEALDLLKRAGVPADDRHRQFLEATLRPAGARVGRNDPCPCGSGKKTKNCHPDGLGAVRLSAGERLIRKLHTWADRPENDERVHTLLDMMGLAEPAAGAGSDTDDDEDPVWWMAHTLAADVLLFDREEWTRFLRVRGPLLPADELELGQVWASTQRSLLEVRAIDPGMGVTVLDLVDGSIRHVSDVRMSRELERMDLVCTRLLPDGGGGFISDEAILVPADARARVKQVLTGGDGLALLAWLIAPTGSGIVH